MTFTLKPSSKRFSADKTKRRASYAVPPHLRASQLHICYFLINKSSTQNKRTGWTLSHQNNAFQRRSISNFINSTPNRTGGCCAAHFLCNYNHQLITHQMGERVRIMGVSE